MTSTNSKLTWNQLKHLSVKEFFHTIDIALLNNLAKFLLSILAFSPILMLIVRVFESPLNNTDILIKILFQIIGYQCLLLGIVYTIWKQYNVKTTYNKYFMINNGLWIFLLMMFLWSFISTLLSNDVAISLFGDYYRQDGFLMYIAYAGIFYAAINLIDKKSISKLIKYLVLSTSFVALLSVLNNTYINHLFNITDYTSVFRNQNHFAYLLSIVCVLAWGLLIHYIKEKNYKKSLYYIIQLIIVYQALIIAKTLGALLACLITIFICSIILLSIKRKILKPIIISSLVVLITIGFQASKSWDLSNEFKLFSKDINTLNDSLINKEFDNNQFDAIGSSRGILLKNAIIFIQEKPLFGYGPDNLGARYQMANIDFNDRPHNELIQFAASLGIPAMIFYILAMFTHLLRFIIYNKNVSLTTWILYSSVLSYLISSCFGNTMFYTSPFFFMILGLSYSSLSYDIKNEVR